YHLISYWVRTFPDHFDLVPITGAERFPVSIGFARVASPLRPRALMAFEEFFFGRARAVYPRYDFARMTDEEYGATMAVACWSRRGTGRRGGGFAARAAPAALALA